MNQRLRVLLIVIISIIICTFVSLLILLEFEVGWTKYGPYHHAALIEEPYQIVNVGNKKYCYNSTNIYELKDNKFELIDLDLISKYNITSISNLKNNDNNIFVKTNKGIIVFDQNMNYDYSITSDEFPCSYLDINKEGTILYSICNKKIYSYDLISKKSKLLNENIEFNHVYSDKNTTIYINNSGRLYVIDNTNIFVDYKEDKGCYITNHGVYNISINNSNILINDEIVFQLNDNVTYKLYDKIEINNDEILFCTYEYLSNECIEDKDCICHYGNTILWSFNIITEEMKIIKQFNSECYLIDYDKINYKYYYDGYIYNIRDVVLEVQKVEPQGSYYVKGENKFHYYDKTSLSLITFYDNEYYYVLIK